jgi:hypothetical protein
VIGSSQRECDGDRCKTRRTAYRSKQPSWLSQSDTASSLHGVGVPLQVVTGGSQPQPVCAVQSDSDVSVSHAAESPEHSSDASSQLQPTCAVHVSSLVKVK